MAIATPPRRAFRWSSPWLIAIVAVVVVIVGTIGVGLAAGLIRPPGRSGSPVGAVTPTPVTSASPPSSPAISPTPIPSASPSPSPTPSASPSPSPAPSASPSPSPSPTPASGVASLSCRIGILDQDTNSGGWISFPGGQFTHDPASNVYTAGGLRYALTYDERLRVWLPVPNKWITPDGLRSVTPTPDFSGIVVAEQDGSTRILSLPAARGMGILRAEPEGVYVALYPGLVLVGWDGGMRWITHDGWWQALSNGSVYGTVAQDNGLPNTIVRLDLESGAVTPYFARPGMVSYIVGSGPREVPVLKVYNATTYEVWLGGTSPVRLAGGKLGQFWVNSVLGDDHGTWMATRTGLYLYTASRGFEFASPVTGYLASPCL